MNGVKVNFGKHNGETLAQIAQFDPSYLDWMVAQGLADKEVITMRDRGEYEHKKLPAGYAIVFMDP